MSKLEPLAVLAVEAWHGDPGSLEHVQDAANSVWRFRRDARPVYLRLTGPRRTREHLLAESHWMRYLHGEGYPLAPPVPSDSGEWAEPVGERDRGVHACVFEAATGRLPDYDARVSRRPSRDWTPEHQVELGRMIGRLHRLTAAYRPPPGLDRPSWRDDPALEARLPADLEAERATVLAWMESLPEATDLVHGDFLIGNYHLTDDGIQVIDFDDAVRAWNAYDLAVSIYVVEHAPVIAANVGPSPDFVDRLLSGYREEHDLESPWIDRIPAFVRYRRILILAACHRIGATDNAWFRRHLELLDRREPLV